MELEQSARDQMMSAILPEKNEALEKKRRDEARLRQKVQMTMREVREMRKGIREFEEEMNRLGENLEPSGQRLGEEFDSFFGIDGVHSVAVDEVTGHLEVFANMPPIGECKIRMSLRYTGGPKDHWTDNTILSIMSWKDQGIMYPHISDNGSCCLGNATGPMLEYLKRQEMFHAVVLMLEFIKALEKR